ncbi:MAG: hypothetical protein ABL974_20645 [Prosthecobacter sp.]
MNGLQFNDFCVSDADVGLNFVSCNFSRCQFVNIRTDGHLWGAKDTWTGCTFKGCRLKGMIAPMNTFVGCRFEMLKLQNFKPYQTVFADCVFDHAVIEGLRAQTISNRLMVNSDMGTTHGQLVFRNCRFESTAFLQCYFESVVFEQCSFANMDAEACSFDGIISDATWWGEQKVDPFTAFLGKALDLIRVKCGSESAAYKEFENYIIDYGSGRTTSRDFSACLYNNRVPYAETLKFNNALMKLVDRQPF